MRRRDVLQVLASAALAAPCGVAAQVTAKTFRLAALSAAGPGYMATTSPSVSVVIKVLAERGYKLGQNLEFQPYGADMQVARLAQLASDIAASKFDAVIVAGYPAAVAISRAFAAVHESAVGTSRHFAALRNLVAIGA